MPPKKARNPEDDSIVSATSIDDYLLPRTVVQRLAKGVLPPNTIISKDATTAILKSTSVFVNYLASNANDRAVLDNHKTIKPEDVFEALREIEFAHFVPRVQREHDTFVTIANTKRNDYRKKQKDEKDAATGDGEARRASAAGEGEADDSMSMANGQHYDRAEDEPSAAKRPRMSDRNGHLSDGDDVVDKDATEDEEEPEPDDPIVEDDEIEEVDAEEEEETQRAQDDTMEDDGVDDSNHYRKNADEDSDDGY